MLKTTVKRALIVVIAGLVLLSCGVARFSASTTATYQITPDGKLISYESNKEQQGLELEIREVDGKMHTVLIKVDKSGTSEAAIAAALTTQLKLAEIMQMLVPLLEKAAIAGS